MLRTKKRVDYLKLKHFSLPLTSIFYMQAILLHTTHHLTIEQSNIPIKMFNLLACQIKKKKIPNSYLLSVAKRFLRCNGLF